MHGRILFSKAKTEGAATVCTGQKRSTLHRMQSIRREKIAKLCIKSIDKMHKYWYSFYTEYFYVFVYTFCRYVKAVMMYY